MITIKNTTEGIIPNLEIKGNTVQNPQNLSDIKSVGIDKGDGTYEISILSCNAQLFELASREVASNRIRVRFKKITNAQTTIKNHSNKTIILTIHNSSGVYKREHRIVSGGYIVVNLDNGDNYSQIECLFSDGWTSSDMFKNEWVSIAIGSDPIQYEPHKQDKSTISLPCQLEKVGDIADRLYFDKVENAWCIEKNIFVKSTRDLNYKASGNAVLENTYRLANVLGVENDAKSDMYGYKLSMCSRFPFIQGEYWTRDEEHYYLDLNNGAVVFFINKSECGDRKEDVIKYMQDIDAKLYLVYKDPKKIVLPLDVQIQLNQFLGTTHVFLECGEVEGTIKATFSKSMASTVQTNTQSINKLDERVKGVEGLKESQDMAYATDKGYLVCKETKNGTIKDLKVSGKSLVNICEKRKLTAIGNGAGLVGDKGKLSQPIDNGVEYTVIVKVPSDLPSDKCFMRAYDSNGSNKCGIFTGSELYQGRGKVLVKKVVNQIDFETHTTNVRLFASNTTDTFSLDDVMVIIGDYTQSPLNAYFEGIASVGNGVDEIEVSSVKSDGNLFDGEFKKGMYSTSNGSYIDVNYSICNANPIKINGDIFINFEKGVIPGINSDAMLEYDNNMNFIRHTPLTVGGKSLDSKTEYVNFRFYTNDNSFNYPLDTIRNLMISKYNAPYQPYKQDKKTILFKDTDGTFKPVKELRGLDTVCDTIELHSDGKYYYHQRTAKSVLNGTSNYSDVTIHDELSGTSKYMVFKDVKIKSNHVISDKFLTIKDMATFKSYNGECCFVNNYGLSFKVLKSSLSTQDDTGFKKFLQSNNVLIIHDLAEEKVFEVNPLFLEAFANETMISCSSGAINPGLELKISSYLPNIVKLNERRISKLEDDFYQYTVVQNRLALTSRYNADRVDFKVDNTIGSPMRSLKALDHDLFNLMKVNIEVGKENYNRVEMEEKMDFYVNEGIIDWDMWDELFEAMELQHNPPVDLTPIEPMTVEIEEDEKPRKSRRGRKKKVVEEI